MRWSPSISQYCMIAAVVVLLIGSTSRAHTLFLVNQLIRQVENSGEERFEHLLPSQVVDWSLDKAGASLRSFSMPFTETANETLVASETLQHLYDIRTGLIYLWITLFILFVVTMIWLALKIRKPFQEIKTTIIDLSGQKISEPIRLCGPENVIEVSKELEKLRRRLVNTNQQRNLFLRHVAHEIKTPLSTIKEATTLLEDQTLGEINPEQKEITRILMRSSNELQRSIENLLAYNSSEAAIDYQIKEEIDLSMVLENVINSHKLALQRTGVRIRKMIEPVRINADRKQVATVFDNLLSNAIKYAPQNSEIKLWLTKSDNDKAEFTIRDQGPGVPKEHRDSIFDAFFMGDDSTNATVKGTGIGLSLAKQYVEAHGGEIQLMETLKGASFRVTFGLSGDYEFATS